MVTKRTPINQDTKSRITPEMVTLFRRMRALEEKCACEPIDWAGKYWKREQCKPCEKWWELNLTLCDQLHLPPWQFPAYHNPDATNPYPEGSHAASNWKPNPDAVTRFHALEQAASSSPVF